LVVTYNLDTARKLPESGSEEDWDGKNLHVMCDGKQEVLYTVKSSAYRPYTGIAGASQTSATQISAASTQPPAAATDSPSQPFKENITVTFFGDPANLQIPVWWRDATVYDANSDDTDHLVAGDIYGETTAGAEFLGHMKFSHTPPAGRLYNYQVKPKLDEKAGRVQVSIAYLTG
jgi:hypothetical protein